MKNKIYKVGCSEFVFVPKGKKVSLYRLTDGDGDTVFCDCTCCCINCDTGEEKEEPLAVFTKTQLTKFREAVKNNKNYGNIFVVSTLERNYCEDENCEICIANKDKKIECFYDFFGGEDSISEEEFKPLKRTILRVLDSVNKSMFSVV